MRKHGMAKARRHTWRKLHLCVDKASEDFVAVDLTTSGVHDGPHPPAVLDRVEGKRSRVYAAEKSVADAFKYRIKVGLDIALQALRTWCSRRRSTIELLLEYACVCRVERVLRP